MNWKIIVGLLLMTPLFVVGLAELVWRLEYPSMTATQAFLEWFPYDAGASLPFIAGVVLFRTGKDEYDED